MKSKMKTKITNETPNQLKVTKKSILSDFTLV